jgi:hypothetical protein
MTVSSFVLNSTAKPNALRATGCERNHTMTAALRIRKKSAHRANGRQAAFEAAAGVGVRIGSPVVIRMHPREGRAF